VLGDILRAGHIPRTRLQTIHRQGPGNRIAHAASQVLAGHRFDNNREVWFVSVQDAESDTIPELVVDIATRRIPAKHAVDPRDVQVLCPGKNNDTGARTLSRTIQDRLNPHRDDQPHYWADDRPFRVGDKVMPIRNDYRKGDHGVFNGSVGTITTINLEERHVHVMLDGTETVTYDFDELDELAHAYAITVHRSQGSEYPYVVVPLSATVHNILLQRNLLYTAITRAKKAVVIVGHDRALATALGRAARRRNTCLTARLQDGTVHSGSGQLTAF
jgi:exodeoxyribonuclease V alpha subunit